jgi:hypothetical protein
VRTGGERDRAAMVTASSKVMIMKSVRRMMVITFQDAAISQMSNLLEEIR